MMNMRPISETPKSKLLSHARLLMRELIISQFTFELITRISLYIYIYIYICVMYHV